MSKSSREAFSNERSNKTEMGKSSFQLLPDECIFLKSTNVCRGSWGVYTNDLILTNFHIILVERGIIGNVKNVSYFPLNEIAISGGNVQVILVEKNIEIYFQNGQKEIFSFGTMSDTLSRIWVLAIGDRFRNADDVYNYEYYQDLLSGIKPNTDYYYDTTKEADDDFDGEYYEENEASNGNNGFDSNFIGDVAKQVFKSGNFSVSGIAKAAKKVEKKRRKESVGKKICEAVFDDLGFTDLANDFIEMGSELCEDFGLKPKSATQRTPRNPYEHIHKLQQEERELLEKKVECARKKAEKMEAGQADTSANSSTLSVNEQIDAVKKLKELLDAGILTEDEFNSKKREVLGL